ncbi:MAG: sulfotransferase domain-containing protein [Sedimenticola sp.]
MMNAPFILLFGMPRSGTTWIGKIFDSHLRTLYRHEPDTRERITAIPLIQDRNNSSEYCDFINSYVNDFVKSRDVSVVGKLPIFSKKYSSVPRHYAFYLSVLLSGAVSKLNSNVKLPAISPADYESLDDHVVVWKSIQLLGRMGIIVDCLKACKAIHILRHPCGYIASVLDGEKKNKFVSYTPASDDWDLYNVLLQTEQARKYDLDIELFRTITPEERLAWRWVLFNEKALDDNNNNENVMILRYEDMCVSPLETTRSCFEFCNLEWNEQTELFLNSSTQKANESYYSVYKNPEIAAYKWKKTLTDIQIELISRVVEQSKIGGFYQNA